MNPEANQAPEERQPHSERPRSKYQKTIEFQKQRMIEVYKVGNKINDLMATMLTGDEAKIEEDSRELERYVFQSKRYDKGFTFEVRNLPEDSYVLELNRDRLAAVDDDETTFVADDIAVHGEVIHLLNHQRKQRVEIRPFEGRIKVMAVFEDTTEEE